MDFDEKLKNGMSKVVIQMFLQSLFRALVFLNLGMASMIFFRNYWSWKFYV